MDRVPLRSHRFLGEEEEESKRPRPGAGRRSKGGRAEMNWGTSLPDAEVTYAVGEVLTFWRSRERWRLRSAAFEAFRAAVAWPRVKGR